MNGGSSSSDSGSDGRQQTRSECGALVMPDEFTDCGKHFPVGAFVRNHRSQRGQCGVLQPPVLVFEEREQRVDVWHDPTAQTSLVVNAT